MEKASKDWLEIYKDWKKSGENQREYCQRRGISFWVFKNQTHKLRHVKKSTSFKAVEIQQAEHKEAPYCEIKFEGGNQIVIERRESLMYLKQLIRSVVQS